MHSFIPNGRRLRQVLLSLLLLVTITTIITIITITTFIYSALVVDIERISSYRKNTNNKSSSLYSFIHICIYVLSGPTIQYLYSFIHSALGRASNRSSKVYCLYHIALYNIRQAQQ